MIKVILSTVVLGLLSSPIFAKQATPAEVLDLTCWKISLPVDSGNGLATTIEEKSIADGYSDPENFYVNEQGDGVVFSSPIIGFVASNDISYTRSDLQEMGRCGDTSIAPNGANGNNWVLSSSPEKVHQKASGVDGTMDAVLSVDEVSTSGKTWQQGRLIFAKIHANYDKPAKLYYRKLPNHELGSVWLSHETKGGHETIYPLVGSNIPDFYTQGCEPVEPTDGIKLGEKWGYQIKGEGNELTVTIRREGKKDIVQVVPMTDSQYDLGDQFMYFKAGVYHINNSGNADERASVTFYDLKVTHN